MEIIQTIKKCGCSNNCKKIYTSREYDMIRYDMRLYLFNFILHISPLNFIPFPIISSSFGSLLPSSPLLFFISLTLFVSSLFPLVTMLPSLFVLSPLLTSSEYLSLPLSLSVSLSVSLPVSH